MEKVVCPFSLSPAIQLLIKSPESFAWTHKRLQKPVLVAYQNPFHTMWDARNDLFLEKFNLISIHRSRVSSAWGGINELMIFQDLFHRCGGVCDNNVNDRVIGQISTLTSSDVRLQEICPRMNKTKAEHEKNDFGNLFSLTLLPLISRSRCRGFGKRTITYWQLG